MCFCKSRSYESFRVPVYTCSFQCPIWIPCAGRGSVLCRHNSPCSSWHWRNKHCYCHRYRLRKPQITLQNATQKKLFTLDNKVTETEWTNNSLSLLFVRKCENTDTERSEYKPRVRRHTIWIQRRNTLNEWQFSFYHSLYKPCYWGLTLSTYPCLSQYNAEEIMQWTFFNEFI